MKIFFKNTSESIEVDGTEILQNIKPGVKNFIQAHEVRLEILSFVLFGTETYMLCERVNA